MIRILPLGLLAGLLMITNSCEHQSSSPSENQGKSSAMLSLSSANSNERIPLALASPEQIFQHIGPCPVTANTNGSTILCLYICEVTGQDEITRALPVAELLQDLFLQQAEQCCHRHGAHGCHEHHGTDNHHHSPQISEADHLQEFDHTNVPSSSSGIDNHRANHMQSSELCQAATNRFLGSCNGEPPPCIPMDPGDLNCDGIPDDDNPDTPI